MKNSKQFLLTLFLAFIIISCGRGPSPKEAANKFLKAFNERNFDEAREYATPETNKLVDLMENLSKVAQSTDSISRTEIEVLDEKIQGETAIVTFREEGSDEVQEMKLKKVDGKWLVHVTKEDVAAKDITNSETNEEDGFWSDEDSTAVEENHSGDAGM